MILPREHGAWGILLIPFVAACILARSWNWLLLPAAFAMLLVFVIREPLLILARQAWVWRDRRPETKKACRLLLWEMLLLAACAGVLLSAVSVQALLLLGSLAAVMTLIAVWMTLNNRQRSVALQSASAFGLASSALFAALVIQNRIPGWATLLWGLMAAHSLATILVVHARLARMASAKRTTPLPQSPVKTAWGAQWAQMIAGAGAAAFDWKLALPLWFSAVANGADLARSAGGRAPAEPLRRVGLRALAVSLLHGALTVAVLWR
jgi:hypothetical protein